MREIHLWPNHVRVPHLDLVLVRAYDESVDATLSVLARFGIDTRSTNLVIHGDLGSGRTKAPYERDGRGPTSSTADPPRRPDGALGESG